MLLKDLLEAKAPTNWTALGVVQNILGQQNVTVDKANAKPGQYIVVTADPEDGPGFSPGGKSLFGDKVYNAEVHLPNPQASDAAHVAWAAHEAYHAYMQMKAPQARLWSNEKYTNQMAAKWLNKNLQGFALQVAMEQITKSRIDYGHN